RPSRQDRLQSRGWRWPLGILPASRRRFGPAGIGFRRVKRHDDWLVVVGWPLVSGLVWPVAVVMPGIGPQHRPQMPLAVDQHPVRALSPHGSYPPFRIAVRARSPRRGLPEPPALAGRANHQTRGGVCTIRTPSLAKTSSNAAVNLASRSRMRNRSEPIRSPLSISRLRACWAVHARSGWPVTRRMCTLRVAISMTNSTYRRLRKTVSTVKKSHASKPSAGARRKACQEVSRPPGAGRYRRERRIRRTVASLTWWPRRVGSPWARRYPQAGFSPAGRSTRSRISWLTDGRPGGLG